MGNVPSEESPIRLTPTEGGQRLDQFVAAARADLSRTEVQRLIKAGRITVNGQTTRPAYRLEPGDDVQVIIPPPVTRDVLAENIPLDVLYEDDDLAAINKSAGMVVHPGVGSETGTVVNAALAHWPQMRRVTGEERAGVVHRLDKDTSGVLVLAKTPAALKSLQTQFHDRTVYKRYLALVEGIPQTPAGIIEAPIGRDPRQRKRMAVVRDGREAVTHYQVVERFEDCALLSLEPKTGRTHQLRVHLAWLGHPVAGDAVYGRRRKRAGLGRMFLHAAELYVDSPSKGDRLKFEAALPEELERVLMDLRRQTWG